MRFRGDILVFPASYSDTTNTSRGSDKRRTRCSRIFYIETFDSDGVQNAKGICRPGHSPGISRSALPLKTDTDRCPDVVETRTVRSFLEQAARSTAEMTARDPKHAEARSVHFLNRKGLERAQERFKTYGGDQNFVYADTKGISDGTPRTNRFR
jgi:hypothetical protein